VQNYKLSGKWDRQDYLLYYRIGVLVAFLIVDKLALSLIPDLVTGKLEGYPSRYVSGGIKEVCSG